MRFNTLIAIILTGVLSFLCLTVALADTGFTGGSYDGYSSNVSTDLSLGGPSVTISSATDQNFVVGQASAIASIVTITDSTGGAVNASNDLRIIIPSGLSMEWDTTKTSIIIGGTASSKVSTFVSYEDSNKTLVLDVLYDFTADEYITVSGVYFNNFAVVSPYDQLGLDIYNTGACYVKDTRLIQIISDTDVLFAGGSYDGYAAIGSSDLLLSSVNSDYFSITHQTYQAIPNQDQTITITAKDAVGNTITGYSPATSVTVTCFETGGTVANSAGLSKGSLLAADFVNGAATDTLTDTESESVTVVAVDQTYSSMAGQSIPIVFSPDAIASYVITATTPQNAGTGWTETVTAKDAYSNTVTTDSSTVVTMNPVGSAVFYTDNTYNTVNSARTYTLSSGQASIYIKDNTIETINLAVTDANGKTGTSGNIVINPAPASKIVFTSNAQTLTAGVVSNVFTVQVQDQNGNLRGSDALVLTLSSSSANGAFDTSSGGAFDGTVTSITTVNGVGTFYYRDTASGTPTITVSRTELTSATQAQTVDAAIASKANISSPASAIAGAVSGAFTVTATDAFGNTKSVVSATTFGLTSDSAGTATFYSDADGTAIITSVTIEADTTSATFYYSDTKSAVPIITATRSAGDTMTPATATGTITINPGTKTKLAFKQQPSSAAKINNLLTDQPIVSIQDAYGNQTTDTDPITLYASTSNLAYAAASGILTVANNPLSAIAGQVNFSGVKYSALGTIYLYAQSGILQPVFSTSITFSTADDATVEAATTPITNFNLIPTNSTLADKFPVLSFKIKDGGTDSVPAQIDRIQVIVGGAGANASTDIAWAGLYQGTTQVATAAGAAITNSTITFGVTPNSNANADLYSVPDNSSAEFTVYVYMKPGKLTATEGQTYTFGINESCIGTDTGLSSQMNANTNKVSTVIGTISVVVSSLEVIDQATGNSTVNTTPGSPINLTIRATDANKNIDKNYINNHVLIFSGLNNIGNYNPIVNGVALGYSTTVNFPVSPGGISATGGVALTAYRAEIASLSAQEVGQNYSTFPLTVTVAASAASAANISLTSGDSQSGKTSVALASPFVVTVTDSYGNTVSGANVTFAISSVPGGATGQTLSVTSATTNASGQAQTTLTLGNAAGQYQVTATSTGLTGSPVTFTSTAVTPSTLTKVSGDSQSKTVALTLSNPFVVKLVGAGDVAIPNETVTFTISSVPSGATGQALSATSVATDANGQAQTTLTLGDKAGDYVVSVSYAGLPPLNFTATASAGAPYKVVLSGPGSTNAGAVSTAFSAIIKDSYDNITNTVSDTSFLLTSNSAAGSFYSDSAGTIGTTSVTVASGASGGTFYYKDTAIGLAAITATRSSGDNLNISSSSASINVLAAGLDHFVVTGSTAALTAGNSRAITITAYDVYGNVKTNLNNDMSIVFSGANLSPAPSANSPTCSNNLGNDINFGADTLLTFTNGIATTTLKLYKAESVLIKANALPVTTSAAQALGFVVKHNGADHLKFSGTINGATVGTSINLGALNAVDLYNNLCDGANGGTAYTGNKTISYVLSGSADAPDGSATDLWPVNPVSFTNGVSADLSATLYRAQSTTITASAADLTGTNIASNSITMHAGAMGKLWFSQQPSTDAFTNVVLPVQPRINVADQYGNAVTSVSDQISLLPSLTNETYTSATNGILSGDSLSVVIVNGEATFSGIKYSYPEGIYLKAHSVGNLAPDIYSYQVTFKTGVDTTITAGTLVKPASISSLVYTDATKLKVFDFKVIDAGTDGYMTKLKQIVVARDTAADTTGGWQAYIAGASISDGSTSIMGTITNDALTFGTGTSIISSVPDGQSKIYTLSIYLNQTLPMEADGKKIAFSVNPTANFTVDSPGSAFAAAGAITSSLSVDVTAVKFVITGDSAVVTAGSGSIIYIKATDVNNNIDTDYSGVKEIVFSGANPAISGGTTYNPTCANYSAVDVAFGNITLVDFTSGQSASTVTMKLYRAESVAIKATTSDAVITTADTDALGVVVTGGAASKLSWNTQPVATVAANAPWSPFEVSVVDAYGNIAPSTINVTVTPTGGNLSAGATAQVATVSGIATFDNFAVYCADYPGTVTLNATANAVTASGASNNVTVAEKYAITIKAFDSVNGSPLTEVTLKIIDSNTGLLISGLTNPITGNSPFSFNLPYGKYSFNFNKTAYVETTVDKTADVSADAVDGVYNNNITWSIYITSTAESLADYRVLSNFVYDETNDQITGLVRLEKRGKQIVNDSINSLKTCTLNIFDPSDANDSKYSASLTAPDANGNYYFNIADAVAKQGFVSGRNYFAKMTILYGGEDLSMNVTYSGVNDFYITVTQALQTLTSQISQEVSGVKALISAEAANTNSKIQEKVSSESAIIQQKISDVKAETAKILTAAETTIPEKLTATQEVISTMLNNEVVPSIRSSIVSTENMVKSGDTLTIKYRTYSGLKPVIDVYNADNELKLNKGEMKEIGATGVYEYAVTFLQSWGKGDFTVVCSEATNGVIDALTITVIKTSLEQIYNQISAVLGTTAGITDLKQAANELSSQFSLVETALGKIGKDSLNAGKDTSGSASALESVSSKLSYMAGQIEQFSKETGINLEKLYNVSEDKKDDILYLKNKTLELKAAVDLSKQMVDNIANKPITRTWYEYKE